MPARFSGLLVAALASVSAAADNTIGAVRVEPGAAVVGAAVTIRVHTANDEAPSACGLRIEYGDGSAQDVAAAGRDGQLPRAFTRSYAHPGNYTVIAYGRPVEGLSPCAGSAAAMVTIAAPPPAAPPAAAAAPVPSAKSVVIVVGLCPEGWTLAGEPAADGSFSCLPKKPAKLDCPPGLAYFEKGAAIGCRRTVR